LFGDDDDVDGYSDVNTEAEARAQAEYDRQQQNANLFADAVDEDNGAEEMRAEQNLFQEARPNEERGRSRERRLKNQEKFDAAIKKYREFTRGGEKQINRYIYQNIL
jgi:hypothetical protein